MAWASEERAVDLIKLRQRQRREQLEAFRLLLLRDGDGGEEGLLGLDDGFVGLLLQ